MKCFKTIEKLCAQEDIEDKGGTIFAIAVKLDSCYTSYNDISEWFGKMAPRKKAKTDKE